MKLIKPKEPENLHPAAPQGKMKGKRSLEEKSEPEESFVSRKLKLFSLFQLFKAAQVFLLIIPAEKKKICHFLWAVFFTFLALPLQDF